MHMKIDAVKRVNLKEKKSRTNWFCLNEIYGIEVKVILKR